MEDRTENVIWKGSPSQWLNFKLYFWSTIFVWLIFPILIMIWNYLVVRTWTFEITDQRIIVAKGVLSKTTHETELYRVKDIVLSEPFFLRILGLSNIILFSSDKTTKNIRIPFVKDGKNLKERLRVAVDIRRDLKKVRELDL